MQEGGFRLNAVASGLKRQRTTTIGTLLHETLPNPFFAEVALGIEQGASELGHNVLVYNARGSAEHERAGRRHAALPAGRGDRVRQAGRPRQRRARARGRGRRRRGREAALRRGGAVLVDNYVGATAAMATCSSSGTSTSASSASRRRRQTGVVVDRVVHERVAGVSRRAARASDLPRRRLARRPRRVPHRRGLAEPAHRLRLHDPPARPAPRGHRRASPAPTCSPPARCRRSTSAGSACRTRRR